MSSRRFCHHYSGAQRLLQPHKGQKTILTNYKVITQLNLEVANLYHLSQSSTILQLNFHKKNANNVFLPSNRTF